MSESETNPGRAQLHASLKQLLPLVAIASGLVAAWLAWSGWQQHSDESRRSAVQMARDNAVQAAAAALKTEYRRLQERLATPAMQELLIGGDLVSAGRLLGEGWPAAKQARVLAPDLASEYGQLPQGGYGRLAAAEAAIAADKPVAWVVKEKGTAQLAVAAPAKVGGQLAGVAYVLLPLQRISSGLDQARVADDGYLALRQGGSTVLGRGDAGLAGGAEAMAAKVPDSDLRVAAAVPDVAGGPLGLGALACFLAAAVFALVALAAWRLPKRLRASAEGHPQLSAHQVRVGDPGGVVAEGLRQPHLVHDRRHRLVGENADVELHARRDPPSMGPSSITSAPSRSTWLRSARSPSTPTVTSWPAAIPMASRRAATVERAGRR